jgi:prepilin-type processing-associated H-X9-DG protein
MNFLVSNANSIKGIGVGNDGKSYGNADRNGWTFNGRYASIRKPSTTILLICEDEKCLDDGYFNPNASQWGSALVEMLASRHELKIRRANSTSGSTEGNEDARGNVVYCDGHAAFVSRKDALRSANVGRPDPDPSGF